MSQKHKYDLFISYASEDAPWVKGYLLSALQQSNVKFTTEEAFTVGTPRLTEFERAVKESARTLLVLSPAYLAENYTQFVDLLAQSYGLETATWPVLPLILKQMDLPTRLGMLTSIDATDPDEWDAVITRLADIFEHPLPEAPEMPDCPYPGMVPFSEADSARFFGRNDEVQEILERLRLHPFLTVIGPSGSGKSSLVYAGVLPALRKSKLFGKGDWQIVTMRPGETPLTSLKKILPGQAETEEEKTLLFVDQFEEVFTLAEDESVPFQEALQELTGSPNFYLILTVRADFYADLMTAPLWEQVQAQRLEVTPLSPEGLRDAIVCPAEDAGVFLEAALVERLLTDAAGEPGILPLVQETLVLLWERIERRFLPLRAYTALVLSRQEYGEVPRTGLQVAIARRGDVTLANLPSEERAIARRIFLRLIQFGEGREDTRRQQLVSDLKSADDTLEQFEHTLGSLAQNRLITLTGEESAESRKVDISHEALITGWPTLQSWVDERREAEQTRRRLETKTTEWVRLGQGEGGLLDEFELLEAESWLSNEDARELGFSSMLRELVTISRKQREKSIRLRFLSIGAIVLLVIGTLSSIAIGQSNLADEQETLANERLSAQQTQGAQVVALGTANAEAANNLREAEEQALLAQVGELSALALSQLDQELDLALLLSIEAFKTQDMLQTQNALYTAWKHHPKLDRLLRGHTGGIISVAWGPEGQLASASYDATVIVWDLDSIQPAQTLEGHTAWVYCVAWGPEGQLASASHDQTVIVWDLDSGQPVQTLEEHTSAVYSVAWGPEGQLVSASDDETIIVWDLDSGQPAQTLEGHTNGITSVVWGSEGQLASASYDGTVIVWDLDSGQPTQALEGHTDAVNNVAWGPEEQLASASTWDDGTIIVWDLDSGQPAQILKGHTDGVRRVAWGPEGQLASASNDETIIVWNLDSGQPAQTLEGHTAWVYSVAWGPEGQLASASNDETVIVWDLENKVSTHALEGHTNSVDSLAWGPERQLASASWDQTVIVWDLNSGQPAQTLEGHTSIVICVAWGPKGQLASASDDGAVIVWDLDSGQPAQTLQGHTDGINSVAWGPEGQLASASDDETVIIWDLDSGQPVITLEGHFGGVYSVAWGPEGQLASASRDETIIVWDLDSGQLSQILKGHTSWVNSVAWGPEGQLASASGDDTVIVWDLDSAQPAQTLQGPSSTTNVAWGPEGQLASASGDDTVIVWDLDSAQPAQTLEGHTSWVNSVAWGPEGQLASASHDETIIVWEMDPDVWIEEACQRAGRNLTESEWKQYLSWRESFDPDYRTCKQWPPGERNEQP